MSCPNQPSPQLIATLRQLGLAAPGQIRRAEKHVRRLARDLPQFESVWIDALAQARLISPFQAAQLNAGRGESLRVGPYLLCQPLGDCPWIDCYRARHVESGETVRLAVADATDTSAAELLPRLKALVAASDRLPTDRLLPIRHADHGGVRIWAASPWLDGRTAATWMVHHGRFPPEMVLEIARAMTAGLAALEKHGLCHGDVAAQSLLLTADGRVVLLQPGLRASFGRRKAMPMPTCSPRPTTIWLPSGSRPARRRTWPATSTHVVACGGICSAAGRRWPAATAWRSSGPATRRASSTCGVWRRKRPPRWPMRSRRASGANRASGRGR